MLELAESVLGPFLTTAAPEEQRERRQDAQARLGHALAEWGATHRRGSELLVRLPFPIPGDAGVESMWVRVTRFDARTVTGRLVDEPLGATDVAQGDEVTRRRDEVEGVELRASRGTGDE
jgi:hypothetical protein